MTFEITSLSLVDKNQHDKIQYLHVLVFILFSIWQALDSVSKGQRKLDLAQRLTGALSSENDRWAENVIDLRADMELLTGDVLLAASFIRCKHSTVPHIALFSFVKEC